MMSNMSRPTRKPTLWTLRKVSTKISRALVALSVATRAVNTGVVSLNPGSANFLSDN